MQNNARYRSVFELMQEIFKDKQPADKIINSYFRNRRYIGSKDRRFISEEIWNIIRHRSRLEFEAGELDARKMLLIWLKNKDMLFVFDGQEYGLAKTSSCELEWLENLEEKPYPDYVEAETPKWIFDKVNDFELLKSLNNCATADFRINKYNQEVIIQKLQDEGFEVSKTPYSPIGLRADSRVNLNNCVAYQDGLIEVQDEASQIVSILSNIEPQDKVIDYCCGAGGKSLTIAYLLKQGGRIDAHDIDASRLDKLKPRMQRLCVSNINLIYDNKLDSDYDKFIIDAPCSGSGTWRRSPDSKYRLTDKKIADLVKVQSQILETAYQKTKIGGKIIYITCSIFDQENVEVVEAFKQKHKDIKSINLRELWGKKIGGEYIGDSDEYISFNPLVSSTDGFFIAIMQKT